MNQSLELQNQDMLKHESPAPEGAEPARQTRVYRPHVNIVDGPDQVTLSVNLPGVNEERTHLTLEKNVLTIRGEVDPPRYEGFDLTYSEYGMGDFERSFQITDEIDREGIQASVKQGVLRVSLPKVKQAVSQKITVSAG